MLYFHDLERLRMNCYFEKELYIFLTVVVSVLVSSCVRSWSMVYLSRLFGRRLFLDYRLEMSSECCGRLHGIFIIKNVR